MMNNHGRANIIVFLAISCVFIGIIISVNKNIMKQIDSAYSIQSETQPAAASAARPAVSASAPVLAAQSAGMGMTDSKMSGSSSPVSIKPAEKRSKKIIYEPPLEDKNLLQ